MYHVGGRPATRGITSENQEMETVHEKANVADNKRWYHWQSKIFVLLKTDDIQHTMSKKLGTHVPGSLWKMQNVARYVAKFPRLGALSA